LDKLNDSNEVEYENLRYISDVIKIESCKIIIDFNEQHCEIIFKCCSVKLNFDSKTNVSNAINDNKESNEHAVGDRTFNVNDFKFNVCNQRKENP
jgi:hypothetical protein